MPMAGKDGMGHVWCAPQSSSDNQAALKASTHRDLSPAKAHLQILTCCRSDVAMFVFQGLFETGTTLFASPSPSAPLHHRSVGISRHDSSL